MQLRKYTEHIVLSFALILVAQLGYALLAGVFSGQLTDPDCYTWLTRVTQLHETRQWFDATLHRVDPPYGLEQHWTRPFDVLLLAGAWGLTPFVGFESGLYAWGSLVSPVLHIAATLLLVWGFAPVFSHRQLVFLALGFIAQPAVFGAFMAGRPDHHSLITFLFVVGLGFVVRMLQEPGRKIWAWGGGLVSALGFWVCIELGQFLILPILASLSVLWFLREKDIGAALFHYSASLLIFSAAGLLIENGFNEFFRPEVDRTSIIFVLFFFLITVYAFFVYTFGFYNKIHYRVIFAGAAAVGIYGVMQAVYPQGFSGPEIDPLYRAVRTGNLGQDQPIYALQWPDGIYRLLFWAGIAVPASLWFVHGLFTRKWWQGLVSHDRKAMYIKLSIFALASLVFYMDYVTQVRYVVYLQVLSLLGYVVLMDHGVQRIESRFDTSRALYLVRPLAIFMMLTWFYYPMALQEDRSERSAHDIDKVATSKYIDELTADSEQPLNIMAAPEPGAYLLYFTGHNVFSIPNHRCKQGFRDWYHLLAAEEDDEALSIVRERQVDMILVNKPRDPFYLRDVEGDIFLRRLIAGHEVSWLERIEAPEDVPQDILIFMVAHEETPEETRDEADHPDSLLQRSRNPARYPD